MNKYDTDTIEGVQRTIKAHQEHYENTDEKEIMGDTKKFMLNFLNSLYHELDMMKTECEPMLCRKCGGQLATDDYGYYCQNENCELYDVTIPAYEKKQCMKCGEPLTGQRITKYKNGEKIVQFNECDSCRQAWRDNVTVKTG